MSLQLVNTFALAAIGIFALISIGVSYRRARKKQIAPSEWLGDWLSDFSTEMAGAFLTAVIFGLIVGAAQQSENTAERKQSLILQMGSPNNGFAIEAVRQLRALEWLYDGSIQGADLYGADLRGADIQYANLRSAYLVAANLQDTYSHHVDLQNAYLLDANLQGARLWNTNLQGTYLAGANLQDAGLFQAKLDESTILPDGTNWTPETDMSRFTDPNHPNFWRSGDRYSPAYRGITPTPSDTPE